MLNLACLFHTDTTTGLVTSKQLKAANDVTVSRDLRGLIRFNQTKMPLTSTEQKYFKIHNGSNIQNFKTKLTQFNRRKMFVLLLQITTSCDFRQCTQKLIFSDRFSFYYPPTTNLLKYLMDFTDNQARCITY